MTSNRDNLAQSEELKQQISDLQKRKKQLQNEAKRRTSWEERKARTKRLIETGALAEKYFGIEKFSLEEREKVFQTFSNFIKGKLRSKE